jgi:glycosyltransferase involved in cell wall biosynthesis
MSAAPLLMALALSTVRRLRAGGFDFDLIDAHYYYPDGVASSPAGHWLDRAGHDHGAGKHVNLIPRYRVPRAWIRWAARKSGASIAVCEALRNEMMQIGIDGSSDSIEERLPTRVDGGGPVETLIENHRVIRCGRVELRERRPALLGKGHDIAIRALTLLPGWSLVIAGDGPLRSERRARERGLLSRVTFAGAIPNEQLAIWYSAADVLVLASRREGWANVLLESMACGTPVVASSVWGNPEVVADPAAGTLMSERTPQGLVDALSLLMAAYPERRATRAYAERYDWAPTTTGQLTPFEQLAGKAA